MALILVLFIMAGCVLAQPPDTLWTHLYGGNSWDDGFGGAPDQSGGFVIVGQTQSFGLSGANAYLVRTSGLNGDTVFTRWYGGSASDQFSDVHTSPTRTLAVGSTSSFGANPSNAYLVCINGIGDTIWTRTINLGGSEAALAVDYGTDYFVAGWEQATGGQPNLMVTKVTDSGTVLWTSTFGGSGIDYGYDVVALPDGGCAVAGQTYNFGIGAPPYSNAWLVRYDVNGDTLWTKTYGDSGYYESANEIVITADSGFALAGYRQLSSFGDQDMYLVKTDADGNLEWSRTYGGAGDDNALDMTQTCDGGYLLGGSTDSYGAGGRDFYLVRADANGDTIWTKTQGGAEDEFCYAVYHKCYLNISDEGYFAAGRTQSYGLGQSDFWLVRLDSDPSLTVTEPDPCFTAQIGQPFTVQWQTHSNKPNRFLRIELNRDYPTGSWELLASSTWDDGTETFTASGPASNHCRVRVTTLWSPTLEAVNPGDFVIQPLGNFHIPNYNWQSENPYTGYFQDVLPADGGYIACGHVYTTEFSALISKVDLAGNILWNDAGLTPQENTSLRRMIHWRDSLYLCVGTLSPDDTTQYGYVQMITESGNDSTYWTFFSSPGNSRGGSDICLTDDGGFLVAGIYQLPSPVFATALIARWNAAGTLVYQDTLNLDTVRVVLSACQPAGNDEYLLAGTRGLYGSDTTRPILIKIDGNGNVLWHRVYPDSIYADLLINDMAVLPAGDVVLVGTARPTSGGSIFYYLITDADGNDLHRWTHARRDENEAGAVTVDTDGGIIVAGGSNFNSQPGDMLLVKHRCDGTEVWSLFFGFDHTQYGYGVCATPDSGYVIAGRTVVCPGGPICADHDFLLKVGGEDWVVPPDCPPADSVVVQYFSQTNTVRLTWVGEETGAYFIYGTTSTAENGDPPGNGWTEVGCVEPIPPATAIIEWTDTNLAPTYKRYTIIHDCNGTCGGGSGQE